MATVKAIVRTTRKSTDVNIRFRLSDGKNIQLFHVSEIKVNVDLWDAKNDCIKKRALCLDEERNAINKAVNDRKYLILSIYGANKDKCVTSNSLERLIDKYLHPNEHSIQSNDFFSMINQFIEKKGYSENRKKAIITMSYALQRYEFFVQETFNKSFRFEISTITKDVIDDIKSFLENEGDLAMEYPNVYEKIKVQFVKHSGMKNKGNNSVNSIFRRLIAFFNWCLKEEIIERSPFTGYDGVPIPKYGTPIYISLEERNKIANYDLSELPSIERQRDIFIFQCLIGCRVGDLVKMTAENVINGAIEYIPQKTKGKRPLVVRVPLNDRAKALIEKYKGIDARGGLFPFISKARYNERIKEIFKICGVTRLVTVINPTTGEEEKRPINEMASSHMARRTFVGNLYKKVKDPNLVGSLSGHAEGSKAFARYREIDDSMKKELVSLIE